MQETLRRLRELPKELRIEQTLSFPKSNQRRCLQIGLGEERRGETRVHHQRGPDNCQPFITIASEIYFLKSLTRVRRDISLRSTVFRSFTPFIQISAFIGHENSGLEGEKSAVVTELNTSGDSVGNLITSAVGSSVGGSVRNIVRSSVAREVGNSVGGSVGGSVGSLVGGSVGSSVGGSVGSIVGNFQPIVSVQTELPIFSPESSQNFQPVINTENELGAIRTELGRKSKFSNIYF